MAFPEGVLRREHLRFCLTPERFSGRISSMNENLIFAVVASAAMLVPVGIYVVCKLAERGFFRRRNRRVMRLLRRYAKWWGSDKSGMYPEWKHVWHVWDRIKSGTIVMRRYSRILGTKKFEAFDCISSGAVEDEGEVGILEGLMEREGVSSPEEFDLWLSQKGF